MTEDAIPTVHLACLGDSAGRSSALATILAGVAYGGDDAEFTLDFEDDVLVLRERAEPKAKPLFVDWLPTLASLRSYPASRKDPMARAVGRRSRHIVDATAGLGADSLRLLTMGFAVTMVERSPVIAALLEDGLRRLRDRTDLVAALPSVPTLVVGDAIERLGELACDCVYLDPMFAPRKKDSPLSRRPLRILGRFATGAPPTAALLEAAHATGRRVVVKRPDRERAPVAEPDESFGGKLVRYDVYLPRVL